MNETVIVFIVLAMFLAGFALGDFGRKACVSKAITLETAKECFKND